MSTLLQQYDFKSWLTVQSNIADGFNHLLVHYRMQGGVLESVYVLQYTTYYHESFKEGKTEIW